MKIKFSCKIDGFYNNLNIIRKMIKVVPLIFCLLTSAILSGCSKNVALPQDLDEVIAETSVAVNDDIGTMKSSSVGGEWALLGLIKSGYPKADERGKEYLKNLSDKLKKGNGKLTDQKYGDYARATIALVALGKNPSDFNGINLVTPLDDYEKVSGQGITVEAFALIASKMAGVTLSNQQRYIDDICKDVRSDGHINDPVASDYLAMELQAVIVCGNDMPKDLPETILLKLSQLAKTNKAYSTSESVSQVIIALTAAKVDPYKDERFFQDGKSPAQWLMNYYLGKGKFVHTEDVMQPDKFATESALLALDSLKLMKEGGRLYEK